LGFEIKGDKDPHWTGSNMPADTFGHFGQSGTYLWVAPNTGRAMVALTDRPFGDWAKPLWSETNAAIWEELAG
ncbi:MAG: serine hydrolase, partial [Corynebacterium marinum]|nr:serine hydrolase [Corynebacterium marinum]